MQIKRQTEARMATFNFSVDHGDRFYLQCNTWGNSKR